VLKQVLKRTDVDWSVFRYAAYHHHFQYPLVRHGHPEQQRPPVVGDLYNRVRKTVVIGQFVFLDRGIQDRIPRDKSQPTPVERLSRSVRLFRNGF